MLAESQRVDESPGVAAASAPGSPRTPRLIGGRYHLINELGEGGMGRVYRVLDRLTGRVVTLKRVKVPGSHFAGFGGDTVWQDRMALAQEFRVLASLAHPNIIGVLDYGFDEDGEPFLTMDLQENAHTIIEAAANQPLAIRVELLVQTLRALAYLHRHGIFHRDLKPQNILVTNDQVKILDFGLSAYTRLASPQDAECAGTLGYIAPELLHGTPPSERSDLYAIGVLAHELFGGARPSVAGDGLLLLHEISPPVQISDEVDPRLHPMLRRLLAPQPDARYRVASEVIEDLAVALDQQLLVETVATRESFLQAAPFVGRVDELNRVMEIIRKAAAGTGSAWLIGGESGVGKSRFLDEVRIWALAEGVVVVRGQGMSQGGSPYHVWREVIRHLILHIELNAEVAAVLGAVVPDIAALLGRDIESSGIQDSDAAQTRLLLAVEEVFRLQPRSVVVVLEDLQWVGSESLMLWSWLARAAERLPLLLLGSFRNDEAPDLPQALRATQLLVLRRLDRQEIATLGEAMVGAAGGRPDLVELLERETEGIPLFVVEVMRVLAESAGRLAGIKDLRLPQRVVSGGLQKAIRWRLSRIRPNDLTPLRTAAVIGRMIDLQVLHIIHPELTQDEWLAHCAAAMVLESRDRQWRFAHDKLREQLVEDLSAASRRSLHRKIAEALESEYDTQSDYVTALAYHWRHAGEPTNEATYAYQAGVLALQSGACQEAIAYLNRTLELLRLPATNPPRTEASSGVSAPMGSPQWWRLSSLLDPNARVDPDSQRFYLGMIEGGLTEAYYRLGDLAGCREHATRALVHFRQHVPAGKLGWILGASEQLALRWLQSLRRVSPTDMVRTRRVASEIARVQLKLTETFFYSLQALPLIWASFRLVNQCEPAGASPDLAKGYMMIAVLASVVPFRSLANGWARRALEIAERTGTPRDLANILSRIAVLQVQGCRWDDAEAGLGRAIALAEEVGDLRLWEECHGQLGALVLYTGQFDRGLVLFGDAVRLTRRSGNRQIECWGLMGQADILVRRGRNDEAVELYREAVAHLDKNAMKAEAVWGFGMFALARLRIGDAQGAYESAQRALSYILTTKPVAYWTQHGTAATAEVLLSLLETGSELDPKARAILATQARQACRGMRRYALTFPLGRPHAHLWEGLRAWLSGRHGRALRLWQKSIHLAEQLRTPYERGRAHLEIGRHLPPDDKQRQHHLTHAAELFEKLGCATDLQLARVALESARPPLVFP